MQEKQAGTPAATGKIFAKVSGVTFENSDSTRRQDILKHVKAGDVLTLCSSVYDGKTTTLLRHELGVVGVLRAEYLSSFKAKYPGKTAKAVITRVTGGTDGKETRGCNIELIPASDQEPEAMAADGQTVVYVGEGSRLFHVNPHCSGLAGAKAIDISKDKSRINGLHACKRCAATMFPTYCK